MPRPIRPSRRARSRRAIVPLAVVLAAACAAAACDDGRDSCYRRPSRRLTVPLRKVAEGDTTIRGRDDAVRWIRRHGDVAVRAIEPEGRWNVARNQPGTPLPNFDRISTGVRADSLVFLLARAQGGDRAEELEYLEQPTGVTWYACVFPVDVPVIAAGDTFGIDDGQVVMRVDQRLGWVRRNNRRYLGAIPTPVVATTERLYVDWQGSIYRQPEPYAAIPGAPPEEL